MGTLTPGPVAAPRQRVRAKRTKTRVLARAQACRTLRVSVGGCGSFMARLSSDGVPGLEASRMRPLPTCLTRAVACQTPSRARTLTRAHSPPWLFLAPRAHMRARRGHRVCARCLDMGPHVRRDVNLGCMGFTMPGRSPAVKRRSKRKRGRARSCPHAYAELSVCAGKEEGAEGRSCKARLWDGVPGLEISWMRPSPQLSHEPCDNCVEVII